MTCGGPIFNCAGCIADGDGNPYVYGGRCDLHVRLRTLAANLAVGAGLCAAFELGREAQVRCERAKATNRWCDEW
jgi:hypothetical protein